MLRGDWQSATLVGRMDSGAGPTPVLIRGGHNFDASVVAPTVAAMLNGWHEGSEGLSSGAVTDFDFQPAWAKPRPYRMLAPLDLQCSTTYISSSLLA